MSGGVNCWQLAEMGPTTPPCDGIAVRVNCAEPAGNDVNAAGGMENVPGLAGGAQEMFTCCVFPPPVTVSVRRICTISKPLPLQLMV